MIRDPRRSWLALAALLLTTVGCGVTSVQNEVDWYKQQLTISEDDRHRLELALAECEQSTQGQLDRTGSLREELERARADARRLSAEVEELRNAPINIEPATSPDAGDPTDFAGIDGVRAERGEGNEIRITLEDQILFPAGSVVIRRGGKEALEKIAATLGRNYAGRQIHVEGHTDNTPPTRVKDRYPTNWELSTARACVVVRALVASGTVDERRVAPIGFGATRPIADNSSKAGQARNRRVEVVVLGE